MKAVPLSRTYARSLIDLAVEAGTLEPTMESVRCLRGLLKDHPDFRTFVESPAIALPAKREALERIFRGKLQDLVVSFLLTVVVKKRQDLLYSILQDCEDLYDAAVGQVQVEATTAEPISAERVQQLGEVFSRKIGKRAVIRNLVRPEVLGGLILRYGDLVADDSIRTSIEKMTGRMMAFKPGSEFVHEN